MKATYINGPYTAICKSGDRKGQPITQYVYGVTGTPTELDKFKEIKKGYAKEDENGTLLYWTETSLGNEIDLEISQKGNIYPVKDLDVEVLKGLMKAEKDPDVKKVLAEQYATALVASVKITRAPKARVASPAKASADADLTKP